MYINSHGYFSIKIISDGRQVEILEHRLNALLNHSLTEVLNNHIHHKNRIRYDNSLENLELLSKSEHIKKHANATGNGNLINGDKCKGSKNPAKRQDVRLKMSESSKKHFPTLFKNGRKRGKQIYGIKYCGKKLISSIDISKLQYYLNAMYFNLKYFYLEGV